MNSTDASFARSIDTLYTYFTSVGVGGKPADRYVTEELQLFENPSSIEHLLRTFFQRPISNLSNVIKKIQSSALHHTSLTQARASFVVDVLWIMQGEKDRDLAVLSKINQLDHLTEHAQITDKTAYVALVKELRGAYKKVLPFDPQRKFESAIKVLQMAPSISWNALPRDVLGKVFDLLSLQDLVTLRRVGHVWNEHASCKEIWTNVKQNKEPALIFSSLPVADNPFDSFQASRQLVNKVLFNSPQVKKLATFSAILGATHVYQGPPLLRNTGDWKITTNSHFFLLDKGRSSKIVNEKRSVPYYPHFGSQKILDGENFFLMDYSLGKPGLTVSQVNPQTGDQTELFKDATVNLHVCGIHDKKLYAVLAGGLVTIVDLDTKISQQFEGPVATNPAHQVEIRSGYYMYRLPAQDWHSCDLKDMQKPPVHLQGSANSMLEEATTSMLFLKNTKNNIIAYDLQTGAKVAEYLMNEFTGINKITISNGLLYVLDQKTVKIFDVFTKKQLRSVNLIDSDRDIYKRQEFKNFQVRDNKIIFADYYNNTLKAIDFG